MGQSSSRPAEERMKKLLNILLTVQLLVLGSAAQNEECPVGTSRFSGGKCLSLLDHCLEQGRLVAEENCGRKCAAPSVPDVNGQHCRDDSEKLRPILMMTELKEILETQLVNLRGSLDTSKLQGAIRDIEDIPSIAGLKEKDYEVLTDALAKLYNVQNSDIVLETYFRYLRDRLNVKVTRIEDALQDTRDGNNKIRTVLRNIKGLYHDSVTEALTKVAVFDAMLTGVKTNKKSLDKSKLVTDLFSAVQTTVLQVDNEYKRKGTEKAVFKALDSLPRFISIGASLFSPNNRAEMENKIQRSLKAVGAVSSQLSSSNWELIQTSGSFLALRNRADQLRKEQFGKISEQLIDEALDRCRDLRELARSI